MCLLLNVIVVQKFDFSIVGEDVGAEFALVKCGVDGRNTHGRMVKLSQFALARRYTTTTTSQEYQSAIHIFRKRRKNIERQSEVFCTHVISSRLAFSIASRIIESVSNATSDRKSRKKRHNYCLTDH